jgi:hypothetical protein
VVVAYGGVHNIHGYDDGYGYNNGVPRNQKIKRWWMLPAIRMLIIFLSCVSYLRISK